MGILDEIRRFWDEDAATYDDAPGHRPRTAAEQAAWAAALARFLPPAPARVLDAGAGTGFLSLVAARLGHRVTAVDLSPEMLERLRRAATVENLKIETIEGSAVEAPPGFDAVMERHLMWTLPDPAKALTAWQASAPRGRLILIESLWGSADPIEALRSRSRELLRRARGKPPNHHASYPGVVRRTLPLGSGTTPSRLVELVRDAGWDQVRLERLRDVEWAAVSALPSLERVLGVAPRFAIVAE